MRRDPLPFLLDLRRAHGDVVQFRLLHKSVVLLAHPDHIRHVLQTHHTRYTNASTQTGGFGVLRAFLGNGLLTSDGAYWLRQRRLMQPAFHREHVAAFGRAMTRAATALADRWERERADTVNLTAEMSHLTLGIIGETLMSADVSPAAARFEAALAVATREAAAAMMRPMGWPGWLPTRRNAALRRALLDVDDFVADLIDQRRRTAAQPADLLSMLMAARDPETGKGMTDGQLRDEVMTTFIAGHETSALALGWTFYLLAKHPTAAARLRTELVDVLEGRVPTVDDLDRLVYTGHLIQESMRLYPPVWAIPRCAVADDEVGGYRVPAGAFILVSPYVTHRHPALWIDPETFDPDRFGTTMVRDLPAFAYCPFGGGPRRCIGDSFASMQLRLVVATLAQRCQFALANDPIGLSATVTLRPDRPIVMRRAPGQGV